MVDYLSPEPVAPLESPTPITSRESSVAAGTSLKTSLKHVSKKIIFSSTDVKGKARACTPSSSGRVKQETGAPSSSPLTSLSRFEEE